MKIDIDNKTKFWILYNELDKQLNEQIVQDLVDKLPFNQVNLGITHSRYRLSIYITVISENYTHLHFGKDIRMSYSGSEFVITEKVKIDNLVNLIKSGISVTGENREAVSAYLRDKKSWNFVLLKSVRE